MTGIYYVNAEELTIGRQAQCTLICKNYEEISSVHAVISRNNMSSFSGEYSITILGRNGGYVNGQFMSSGEKKSLFYSDIIEIFGVRILWLGYLIVINYEKEVDINPDLSRFSIADESLEIIDADIVEEGFFNKSPRNCYSATNDVIELEAPPEKRTEEDQSLILAALPACTMALPMIMGYVVSRLAAKSSGVISSTFMYTGLVTAVCSSILGIIWVVLNIGNRNKQIYYSEERRKSTYIEYVNNAEEKIRECYNRNISNLYLMYPEVKEYFRSGNEKLKMYDKYLLWNRNSTDEDFLCIRLGIGNLPYDLSISLPKDKFSLVEDELKFLPRKLKDKYAYLKDVPVTVDLRELKCIGVIGEGYSADEMFLTMIMALAVSVSPVDVEFVFIFRNGVIKSETLRAIRFLPHQVNGSKQMNSGIGESELDLNMKSSTERIIFTDCSSDNENNQINQAIRIIFAREFRHLPHDCKFILQKGNNFGGYIDLRNSNSVRQNIHFDKVNIDEAERYARELSGIRVRNDEDRCCLPDTVGFFELYGKILTPEYIKNQWIENSTADNIKIPIGIAENGKVLEIDLHEKGSGPHGLIAGMTGSGKSEILQTIILSLAVKFSPEEIGFFLIDYKGGGMSELFSKIPHILGSISNLSGRMIYRAMASVRSENEKRQRLFNKYGVNNISAYRDMYKSGIAKVPLPHIFIIIDEFAELKRDEPEFMKELISVARVGRSLGIHLLLATQKPSGTVDDNILSNSRFRICLKVQDRMDSMEMLKRPDAAHIARPGQAFLQVGNDEILLKFQGAYTMDKSDLPSKVAIINMTDSLGKVIQRKNMIEKFNKNEKSTQLDRTVRAIETVVSSICENDSFDSWKMVGMLWLPPLSDYIVYKNCNYLEDKEKGGKDSDVHFINHISPSDRFKIPIGIYDNPSKQKQGKLYINVTNTGHHIILGNLQSGKSTLLVTISYALQNNLPPNLLNMYFIDFSHNLLRPFKSSIHTGAYINEENEEDIEKLIIMLEEAIAERKELLKGGNYKQYIENMYSMPAMVVVIDGFGLFRERTRGIFDRNIEYILKNGEALGIYIIVSALDTSSTEIPRRILSCFKGRIPLQLKDRYEYKDTLLVQNDAIFMPESVQGRGLFNLEEEIVEFQAYVSVDADNDFERTEKLKTLISARNDALRMENSDMDLNQCVTMMPVIPSNLSVMLFRNEVKNRVIREKFDLENNIPIGFEEHTGRLFGIPFVDGLIVVISGRKGSGKKNLYSVISEMFKEFFNGRISEEGLKENNREIRVIIYDESLSSMELSLLKEEIGRDPYVIHLGGALDRQNIADFSYIPYSKQTEMSKPGRGIVRKTLAGYKYGEIRIPRYDLC